MASPKTIFHNQSASETVPSAVLGEALELMRRSGKVFLQGRLLAGQTRLRLPIPSTVGRCLLIDYYCILIFLRRARLPLRRKYQLLGLKVPWRLSIDGSHSTKENPLLPIWRIYSRQCFGCRLRCGSRGRVKILSFRSLPTLVRKISSRRSKTTFLYVITTLSNRRMRRGCEYILLQVVIDIRKNAYQHQEF